MENGTIAGAAPWVLRRDDAGVTTLTLNRGERFNPLSSDMLAALDDALDGVAADPSVRVVVLAGAGRGFCAGHDLRELRAHAEDLDFQRRLFGLCARVMQRLTELPQPVIARVHGVATAAGCQLVSMCDLAVASTAARFALPGVNIGVFCSTPAVGVVRSVGRKRAMELLLTGQLIDAETALSWGLLNRVVAPAELDAEIGRFTEILLSRSAAVIGLGKRVFYQQADQALGPAYEQASEAMVLNLQYEDAAEGIDAFLLRRPARFVDR